jgi:tetratricopeptide (TPR) repeat protein
MVAFATLAGLLLRHVRPLIILVAIAALAAVSSTRTEVWRTERSLWTEAVGRAPRKVRPLLQLSRALDFRSALQVLDRAEVLAPDDPRPSEEKGVRLLHSKRPDLALVQFERALALRPQDSESLNNRAVALSLLGRRDAAIEDLRHALKINPCLAPARRNLERLGGVPPSPCGQ